MFSNPDNYWLFWFIVIPLGCALGFIIFMVVNAPVVEFNESINITSNVSSNSSVVVPLYRELDINGSLSERVFVIVNNSFLEVFLNGSV